MSWTRHIKNKMVFYHLSGAQILRIFRRPDRREEGIAEGTAAAMCSRKSNTTKKHLQTTHDKPQARHEELWIMYRTNKKGVAPKLQTTHYKLPTVSRITMISAWRYPGVTKAGERPPIPLEIAEELARGTID